MLAMSEAAYWAEFPIRMPFDLGPLPLRHCLAGRAMDLLAEASIRREEEPGAIYWFFADGSAIAATEIEVEGEPDFQVCTIEPA